MQRELRVLLVDDDEEDYLLTRRYLASIPDAALKLDWVDSYDEALGVMVANQYSVYLLDYRLGIRTGLELLQEAIAGGCTGPAIMLTGQGDRDIDLAALEAGAADYLVKSDINAKLLERSIRYAVMRRQAEEGALRLQSERAAREETERIARRLHALQRISDVALSDLPTDGLLQEILQRLAETLSADTATVLMLDEAAGVLQIVASHGLEGEKEQGLTIPLGAGIAGRVAAMRSPAILPDLDAVGDVVSPVLRQRVRSLVVAPLLVGSRVIGVMHAGSARPGHFGTEDLQLLELASGRVASAIERARLLEQAQIARAEAEQANRAKSDFLANMSHELRTPINAIMGYSDLLDLEIAGKLQPGQRSHVNRIRASSKHLLHLINEILDLAKIESGRMDVALKPTALRPTIQSSINLVEPQAQAKGLNLQVASIAEGLTCVGDDDRICQIVLNLLSNGVKFTPAGGSIVVRYGLTNQPDPEARLGGAGPWVFVRVEDTGVGIAADQMEQVFQPFVQVGDQRSRAAGGTGLGLTISREFARLMHGDLTLRSVPGKGSCFTLWLVAHGARSLPASQPEISSGGAVAEP